MESNRGGSDNDFSKDGESDASKGWRATPLAVVGRYILGLLSWLLFSALVGLFAGWTSRQIGATVAPLSPYFGDIVVICEVVGTAVTVGGLSYIAFTSSRRNRPKSPRRKTPKVSLRTQVQQNIEWARQHPRKVGVAFALIMFSIAMTGIWLWRGEAETNRLAVESATYFRILEQPGTPTFDVKSLRAQLEETRQAVSAKWEPTSVKPIDVVVYPDRSTYLQQTGNRAGAGGHTECLQGETRIHLFLEEDPRISNLVVRPSTVRHEVAHAVVCQALGAVYFHGVPDWLHEGYARSVEYGGWSNWLTRARNRIYVWEARYRVVDLTFCKEDALRSSLVTDDELFYATAWEFIRWLDSQNDRNTVLEFKTAAALHPADAALREVLGGSCEDKFQQWKQEFVR